MKLGARNSEHGQSVTVPARARTKDVACYTLDGMLTEQGGSDERRPYNLRVLDPVCWKRASVGRYGTESNGVEYWPTLAVRYRKWVTEAKEWRNGMMQLREPTGGTGKLCSFRNHSEIVPKRYSGY